MAENKTIQLIAHVDSELGNRFRRMCRERKQVQMGAHEAALKLWMELPIPLQAQLLNQDLDSESFVQIVQAIVDERIAQLAVAKSEHRRGGRTPKRPK